MSSSLVIKIPLADTENLSVLIDVTAKKKDDLDFDLLATDGDSAFKGKVRERNFVKLRAKNYDGADDEWKAVLTHTFRSKQVEGLSDTLKKNLEVSCSRTGEDPKAVLTIHFRSRVEDITQRLGAIELPQTDDTEGIDLFGWASQLVDERSELEAASQHAKHEAESAQDAINSLRAQLADLAKAKDEHEDNMMTKFAELLNEKKRELRKRSRQLSTAKMDPKKVEQFEQEHGLKSKKGASRGRKRAAQQLHEDSESDGFEDRMDVDNGQQEDAEDRTNRERSRSTVRASDTESEDDDDLDHPVTSQTGLDSIKASKPSKKPERPEAMPPHRELPFTKKSREQQKAVSPKPQTPEDDATASEDDEL